MNQQLSTQKEFSTQAFEEQIPIVYIWFGPNLPEDYVISLSEMEYPVIFLKNPKIQRKFSRELLDIQKSDYYRLWYLYQHGGIYSDFDNTINYSCLLKLLAPYKNDDKLIFMTDGRHTREQTQQITTNLIYAPKPKLPILKKMLDYIDETKQRVWQFAGIKFVGQFQEPIEMNMSKCVYHSYDWSWYQASNEVLGANAGPHPHYAKKLIKKSQILLEMQKMEQQLKDSKAQLNILRNDLRRISNDNIELKNEMIEVHQKILEMCPSAYKILDQYQDSLSTPINIHSIRNVEEQVCDDKEQLKLWNKISSMSEQNKQLKFKNKILQWEVYGIVAGILVILIISFFFLQKKKTKQFKKIENAENQAFFEH